VTIPFHAKIKDLKHTITGRKMSVSFKIDSSEPVKKAFLWVRNMPSTADWKVLPMEIKPSGEVIINNVHLYKYGNLYKVEILLKDGGIQYPNPILKTPWVVVDEDEVSG
jgi:hypothetical protein